MWGATCNKNSFKTLELLFQFTLPCGERLLPSINLFNCKVISIHAPVWGATYLTDFFFFRCRDFNSRSRVGSDKNTTYRTYANNIFQFTLPCGERLKKELDMILQALFQFTLPCGERRLFDYKVGIVKHISIHAPVWGATQDDVPFP